MVASAQPIDFQPVTADSGIRLMEIEERGSVEAAAAASPVRGRAPAFPGAKQLTASPPSALGGGRAPSPTAQTKAALSEGGDVAVCEAKHFLCILGVAKLSRAANNDDNHRWECKSHGEDSACPETHERFDGLAFRVVGTGVDTEDYDAFGDAIERAQDEGFVSRERGVERLLLRTFAHGSQKVILVLSKSPAESGPPSGGGSPGGETTSSSSSGSVTVTTGEIMSEVLYSAYVSISKFLDGVRDVEREYAAVTVTSASAFRVIFPHSASGGLNGPPHVQLHEADGEARSLGFWRREPAVEAFLSLLPLDGGHKIVHVFSKLALREPGGRGM